MKTYPPETGLFGECLEFLRQRDLDTRHPLHVAKNAGTIFECLMPLHGLGEREEKLLLFASVLHDVGWSISEKGHHKHSMDIIMGDRTLDFSPEDRAVIANIARYHRKSLPSDKHGTFCNLDPADRNIVLVDSAILRVADALDRMHMSRVDVTGCDISGGPVIILCRAAEYSGYEMAAFEKKSDLFRQVFGREVKLGCPTELKRR